MRRALAVMLGAALLAPTSLRAATLPVTIERRDPRFDALVPRDAVLEILADGLTWVEGPLWVPSTGQVLFSDIPKNRVMRWKQNEGLGVFLEPSGYTGRAPFTGREPGSNGLALDAQGRLLLCQHGDRRIVRVERDGAWTTLAERYQGRRLNSPNDLIVRANGDIWFTDPPFGLPRQFDDPARELDFTGVFRLDGDGTLTLATRDVRAPNGLAFSPDGKTLYVSSVDAARPAWWAFDVRPDGTLGLPRLFHDAAPLVKNGPGLPDGLKVDRDGNVFASGPGGIYVFAPDGALLGSLLTGRPTSNLGWGEDGRTLFVTSDTALLRLRVSARAP